MILVTILVQDFLNYYKSRLRKHKLLELFKLHDALWFTKNFRKQSFQIISHSPVEHSLVLLSCYFASSFLAVSQFKRPMG